MFQHAIKLRESYLCTNLNIMLSKIIREKAIEAIESLYRIRFTERDFQVSPTKPEFEGDYTIVLFSLIKQLKSSPETLGNALGNKMIIDVTNKKSELSDK